MAPQYKLTYFDLKGLGESIRFLLSYMKADWKDIRISYVDDWPKLKDNTPFGKVPVLEVNGKELSQSISILRYLGKQAGLAGKDDWENAQIDIIADTLTDLRIPIGQFIMEQDAEVKKTKQEAWTKETLPFYLKRLEAVAKENKGYLANGKLSWADLLFAALSEFFEFSASEKNILSQYPNLNLLSQKIFSLPQIADWVAKRPVTPL